MRRAGLVLVCMVAIAFPAWAADKPAKKAAPAKGAKKAAPAAPLHKLEYSKDGVMGYRDTPIQPWSGFHVHDPDRPVPKKVDPGLPSTQQQVGRAPADAIVLFDGKDLSAWQPNAYKVEGGSMIATQGPLLSKQQFGSCQLHLEFMAPNPPEPNVMNRGNNGLFFGETIEVQIYDSYEVKLYADGQAAAIYAQTPPLVNACRAPGQWQMYDVLYQAPRFDAAHKLLSPARITMLHNGLLVHWNQEVYGSTPHCHVGDYSTVKTPASIRLGAHHCPVRFRNIWVRPLADPVAAK